MNKLIIHPYGVGPVETAEVAAAIMYQLGLESNVTGIDLDWGSDCFGPSLDVGNCPGILDYLVDALEIGPMDHLKRIDLHKYVQEFNSEGYPGSVSIIPAGRMDGWKYMKCKVEVRKVQIATQHIFARLSVLLENLYSTNQLVITLPAGSNYEAAFAVYFIPIGNDDTSVYMPIISYDAMTKPIMDTLKNIDGRDAPPEECNASPINRIIPLFLKQSGSDPDFEIEELKRIRDDFITSGKSLLNSYMEDMVTIGFPPPDKRNVLGNGPESPLYDDFAKIVELIKKPYQKKEDTIPGQ